MAFGTQLGSFAWDLRLGECLARAGGMGWPRVGECTEAFYTTHSLKKLSKNPLGKPSEGIRRKHVLGMRFSIVENLSGLCGSMFDSLFSSTQLNSHEKSKIV